jgi:Domain of unknown function (DUF4129)
MRLRQLHRRRRCLADALLLTPGLIRSHPFDVTLVATSLLLIVLSSVAVAQPQDVEGISLDRFLSEIDRLSAEIGAAATPEAVGHVTAGIPGRWRVVFDAQQFDVDSRWLTATVPEALRKKGQWPATRAAIQRRLGAMREQAAALAPAGAPARDRGRAELSAILERDEFKQSAASRWREKLQERLGEWFEELASRFGAGPGVGRTIAIGLAWVAALGALIGLGFLVARSIAERPRQATLNLAGRGPIRPRAREHALRALASVRAGNPREAVRFAYHAAVTRLEEEGVWRVDDARTPREYLPMLRATDARRPVIVDLTRRFERVWYGNHPAAPDDTDRVTAHLEELGCLRPGERAT